MIATLEWSCRNGAAAVAVLAKQLARGPPWDRVLLGALVLHAVPEPPSDRLIPPLAADKGPPGSAVERRMRRALAGLLDD